MKSQTEKALDYLENRYKELCRLSNSKLSQEESEELELITHMLNAKDEIFTKHLD